MRWWRCDVNLYFIQIFSISKCMNYKMGKILVKYYDNVERGKNHFKLFCEKSEYWNIGREILEFERMSFV